MPAPARAIILEVAARRGVDPILIVNPCRRHAVFHARAEVARMLSARGYSALRIGALLNHDHTTIIFYLGTGKKRPSPERPPKKLRWKAPQVRHLRWIVKPASTRPATPRAYLKPYAGADMTEYIWKPRDRATARTSTPEIFNREERHYATEWTRPCYSPRTEPDRARAGGHQPRHGKLPRP
jgi:hypothetical protein